jgi:hypothetical protein
MWGLVGHSQRFSRSYRSALALGAFTALSLATACSGSIIGDDAGNEGGPGSANGGNGKPGSSANGSKPGEPGAGNPNPIPESSASPGTLRRLTKEEYRNTISDLLQIPEFGFGAVEAFTADARVGQFRNNLNSPVVETIVAQYAAASEAFSTDTLKYNGNRLPSCDLDSRGESGCASFILADFGKRALRRPLDAADTSEFLSVYESARARGDSYTDGLRVMIDALLQSPEFLYHLELGDPSREVDGKIPLTGYEIASKLSYLFWASMPDDELFDAADAGQLDTTEGVLAQVERILALPRTRDTLTRFFAQWLQFDSHRGIFGNDAWLKIADFTEAEARLFVQSVIFDGDGKFETLFTAPYTFANERTAEVYGLSGIVGDELRRVELNPSERAGFLTMPVIMGNTSHDNGDVSPVLRGRYVRERLLCQEMPPPPPEASLAPSLDFSLSLRERYAQHSTDPICANCHKLMDPIGLAFNPFDSAGQYDAAAAEAGDNAGEIFNTRDADGSFAGIPELAAKLAVSEQARDCAVQQWFRFSIGRPETELDDAAFGALRAEFRDSGYNLRRLFAAITVSDAFRTIDAPKGCP